MITVKVSGQSVQTPKFLVCSSKTSLDSLMLVCITIKIYDNSY